MFDPKHIFFRSALKLTLLFILVELTTGLLIWNASLHPQLQGFNFHSHWDSSLGQLPDVPLRIQALYLHIPVGFLLFLLMGWRIAKEKQESAHKQLRNHFPYFKQLTLARKNTEIQQWLSQQKDLALRDYQLIFSFLFIHFHEIDLEIWDQIPLTFQPKIRKLYTQSKQLW